ncbi:beta strand repeat-containing protein [Oleiharenicola lentus]|uniref:beta strand repeat-containing protein n=1 Tax=Oleiharenicola lentus TaxID=2508720 RepID=UPI003F665687
MGSFARAQTTLYWDTNGAGIIFTGSGGPSPTGTWSTSAGNWNSVSNGAGLLTGSSWTQGSHAVFSAGTDATGAYDVTISGNMSAASVLIEDGTPTITGGTLTIGATGFEVGASRTATVSSVIAGANGLTKAGAGTLVLNGVNTFTGGVNINAGTLRLSGPDQVGNRLVANTLVSVASGATLEIATTNPTGTFTNAIDIALNGGTYRFAGAANTGSHIRNLTLTSGASVTSDAGVGSYSGFNVALSGNVSMTSTGTATISLEDGLGLSAAHNFSAVTSGTLNVNTTITEHPGYTGSINKTGAGVVTLSGTAANTYTGGTTVSEGILLLSKTDGVNAVGSGGITVGDGIGAASSATLRLNASNQIADNLVVNINSDGHFHMNGNSETVRAVTGTGRVHVSPSVQLTLNDSGNSSFAGNITGSGTIVKQGSGTVTLTGGNTSTFTGALTIADGTMAFNKTAGVDAVGAVTAITVGDGSGAASSAVLQLLSSHQIANTTSVAVSLDGLFSVNGLTEVIAAVTGIGRVELGGGHLTVGEGGGASLFGGTIAGTGIFEVTTSGSLALQSSLVLESELRLSGGTLYLSGHNLTAETLHITASSTIDFAAGGNSTLTAQNFIIDEGAVLTIQNWSDAADYFFAYNWEGAVLDLRGNAPNTRVVFADFTPSSPVWQGYDKQITPVPEPSTYGAIIMGALGSFFAWRRWKKSRVEKRTGAA